MGNLDRSRSEIEVEAAAFRRLVAHLRQRPEVKNKELMDLAGFCRNCLSNWYEEEAAGVGASVSSDAARERIYGMPYEKWRSRYEV